MIYLQLFWEFAKIGLFTVGGGMASLPYLYELAEKYPWFTAQDITNMVAISESTPGPIGINMATYTGYQTAGVLGGIIATLAIILPEVIIVLVVANYLEKYNESRLVQAAFYGIRPTVVALISLAFFTVFRSSVLNMEAFAATGSVAAAVDPVALVLFAVAFVLIYRFKKHPLWYILGGAVVGILLAPNGA
ncbi:chromate transporter [Ruminococcaceae bacterium OttesenSCG-928-O06]|nr:chromate transporter [Ruminococcaceae bacterium OttesenSCG-928-O06]